MLSFWVYRFHQLEDDAITLCFPIFKVKCFRSEKYFHWSVFASHLRFRTHLYMVNKYDLGNSDTPINLLHTKAQWHMWLSENSSERIMKCVYPFKCSWKWMCKKNCLSFFLAAMVLHNGFLALIYRHAFRQRHHLNLANTSLRQAPTF